MNGARRDFFVTGTDTGVGKTLAGTALLRALRGRGLAVAGMKPVASGAARTTGGLRNEDALALAAEGSRSWPYETINPYCFEPAIAPHIAAAEAGVEIRVERIEQAYRSLQAGSDTVIVEGAGGFRVPLGPRLSFADVPGALGLEVLLVVGLRLGCLNHAFLTVEAIAARGLRLAGWIGNQVDPAFARRGENVMELRRQLAAPCLGILPFTATAAVAAAAASLDLRWLS